MDKARIGVIGAGTMGSGIAQAFASAGHEVTLCDITQGAVTTAIEVIARSLDRFVAKAKIDAGEKTSILARIAGRVGMEALADADVVVEAVPEDAELKLKTFAELDSRCKPGAILASNTSSLSLTRIAAATRRPAEVIGMHFMNPVPVMPLVELVRALQTSDRTHGAVEALARGIGKTPVTVRNSPGFVSNRILMPMINEAIGCLHEGVAGASDIDTIMKLGMNHPMGPLELADLIGLDTCLAILEVLYHGFGDPRYRPCPLLRDMVEAGWLGKKTGKGFYEYGG